MVQKVNETAKKILFNKGQSVLSSSAKVALDALAGLLQSNTNLGLNIQGHASKEGEHYINLGLSNSRANAVRDYLVSRGIDKNRLQVSYFGSGVPLTNDPAKQAINRRVELKLIQ
ncbi:MAG: OmpA family protein [Chitinophagaceae bacterium]|nr:OmpA family protein [Chitinophagaceae bacterium]